MDGGARRGNVEFDGRLIVARAAAAFEHLRTELGIDDPDGFYAELIALHEGLTPEQSDKINAKLILMLSNHVGDRKVLDEILNYLRKELLRS
jgi:Protein of unknown function (DUF2783)